MLRFYEGNKRVDMEDDNNIIILYYRHYIILFVIGDGMTIICILKIGRYNWKVYYYYYIHRTSAVYS